MIDIKINTGRDDLQRFYSDEEKAAIAEYISEVFEAANAAAEVLQECAKEWMPVSVGKGINMPVPIGKAPLPVRVEVICDEK